jgi:hypothetical protein
MRLLVLVLLLESVFAQVPHIVSTMDVTAAPELRAHLYWDAVPGAIQYNVYRYNSAYKACNSSGAFTLEDTVASPSYLDDPSPNWYAYAVGDGHWKDFRRWCYAVTSLVNGLESAQSNPVEVIIGNAWYLNLEYVTDCVTHKRVVPFPYPLGMEVAHFYFTDDSGVKHEIPSVTLQNATGFSAPANQEWESKTPIYALDGYLIPWEDSSKYTYTLDTPDGGHYSGRWAPPYNTTGAYFNTVTLIRVQGGPDCPVGLNPLGANYNLWQNVTR